MKRLGIFILAASLTAGAFAQDLDTVTVTDQLNVGTKRGENFGSLTSGAAKPDGTEFSDYSGVDVTTTRNSVSVTTSVRYINSWGTSAAANESPIVTVTSPQTNPDRPTYTLPAVVANTRPGATGGSTGILIGDDGGYNALFFGESNDKDYYVQVDMFCPVATVGVGFEQAGLVARAASDDVVGGTNNTVDYGYNPTNNGSYALVYDYQAHIVKAVVYDPAATVATGAVVKTQFGSTITGVTDGWHTFRIECKGTLISFRFDGTLVASVTDTTMASGRPGIFYVENTDVPDAQERQGLFDHIVAGPQFASDVNDWTLY